MPIYNLAYGIQTAPTPPYPTPIIRFPFTTNLTDTTNTYTLTANGASVTTLDGVKCLDCTSGNVWGDVPILPQGGSARVNMFWMKTLNSSSNSIYSYGDSYAYTYFDSVFNGGTNQYVWQNAGYGQGFTFTRWGLWTHVALVLSDSTHGNAYINGEFLTSMYWNRGFNTTGTLLTVGAECNRGNYGSPFGGHIADFIVDNTAWTADDIKEYYNATCSTYGLSPIS